MNNAELEYINNLAKRFTYKPPSVLDSIFTILSGPLFATSYENEIEQCPEIKSNPNLEKLRKDGKLTIKAFYEEIFLNVNNFEDIRNKIDYSELVSTFKAIEKIDQKNHERNSIYGKIMTGISLPLAFMPVVVILSGAAPWALYTSIGIGSTFTAVNLVKILSNFIRNNEKETESKIFNKGSKIINEYNDKVRTYNNQLMYIGSKSAQYPDLSFKQIEQRMNNTETFNLQELKKKEIQENIRA